MMAKKQWVESLAEGTGVDDLFLVAECDLRRARNGSLYMHLILGDRTGKVNARKWDARAEEAEGLEAGSVIRVKGFVESYRGRPQVIVRRFEAVGEADRDPGDFLPSSARDSQAMLKELEAALATVENPQLRALFDSLLGDPGFRERFGRAPAAVRLHHAYLGGLLEHSLSLVRCAMEVAPLYPGLDRDLLVAGAFLHDIGKTQELEHEGGLAYTDRGKLIGHITLGVSLLEAEASRIEGFPRALLDRLTHLILSHHGRYEFGSPKLPQTAEALALSLLDDLDAKLNAVETLKGGSRKGNWTEYVHGFERAFFVGGDD